MGLFGNKIKTDKLRSIDLRQGTQIPLVDVDAGFVQTARNTYERQPKVGHAVPVQVAAKGKNIVVLYQGQQVARMDPELVPLYMADFKRLEALRCIGKTVAYIKWEGSKTAHGLALNWGSGAADGGVLPAISISL
jgi:hypothetical protein